MNIPDIIIAVDGYSSTGKSTFAKLVAEKYSFLYLDSGALYRGVTLYALENGLIDPEGKIDEDGLKAALETLDLGFQDRRGTFHRGPLRRERDPYPGGFQPCQSGFCHPLRKEFR